MWSLCYKSEWSSEVSTFFEYGGFLCLKFPVELVERQGMNLSISLNYHLSSSPMSSQTVEKLKVCFMVTADGANI